MSRPGGAERAYGSLLRLYPEAHRAEYGPAMVQLFGDRWRDEQPAASPGRLLSFWGGIVGDVMTSAFHERTEGAMGTFKSNWWMWLAGLVGTVTLVLGIAGLGDPDRNVGQFVIAVAILLAGIAVLIGLRRFEDHPSSSANLIMLGSIPAFFSGIVFFWFPPMWLLTAAAIAVMVKAYGVASGKKNEPASV